MYAISVTLATFQSWSGWNDASHLPQLDSPRTKFPRLRISTQSQLEGTKVQCIYTKHPNHSWRNDYDRRYTENTLTALYTTDQQHVLICSTYLSRNNHRRRGRLCTTLISLHWSVVLTFHGTITVGKVDDVPTRSVSTDRWYLPSTGQLS